jgi:hypothetical protein
MIVMGQIMILAFDGGGDVAAPELHEVLAIWPVAVILLLSLLVLGAYYLGLRSGRTESNPSAKESQWSRAEIIGICGLMIMAIGVLVTLLNPEVRKWLGL